MSRENVEKLIKLSGRDDRLRSRIEQICNDPGVSSADRIARKVAAIAVEYGLPFGPQVFIDYINTQPGGEISDDDLDSVVGGINRLTAPSFPLGFFPLAFGGYGGLGLPRG
ncbi:MAG TPA: hypothetical protein VNQ90_08050 [Chthoniobacteraceae bacterium]|nr:hypothetical protein [Chthoniobacteraceae bacterium]